MTYHRVCNQIITTVATSCELVEYDEHFHGLVAINWLETYVVRLSIKLLKELVDNDENFNGLVAINWLETYVVRLSIKLLKERVEHDENFNGLVAVNSL
jgi:hypothetical protein